MKRVAITGIGRLLTGSLEAPSQTADSLLIEDGLIAGFDVDPGEADLVVDAKGLTVMPGLIDGHVHPVIGEYSPVLHTPAWATSYLHCGVTTMVSAGELHYPGLPLADPDPQLFKALAVLNRGCMAGIDCDAKLEAGTLLLAPGMQERDFDEVAERGIRLAKFIFYPFGDDLGEAQAYVRWCRERGIRTKLHSGGVSRSGASAPAGYEIVQELGVDIVAHATGGPIPMPDADLERLIQDSDVILEIATSGNFRLSVELARELEARGELGRLTLGTDTPGGTGVMPRGNLRNLLLLSSVAGLTPEQVVCVATGNTGAAHGLPQGVLEVGRPADLILLGAVRGSAASDASESIRLGDLPGVSMVFVDGEPVVVGSEQTPPPTVQAEIVGELGKTRRDGGA